MYLFYTYGTTLVLEKLVLSWKCFPPATSKRK